MCVSVCLSVTTKSVDYLVFTSQRKFYRILHGVFEGLYYVAFAENASFYSSGIIAGHRYLPRSLVNFLWTSETAMASV